MRLRTANAATIKAHTHNTLRTHFCKFFLGACILATAAVAQSPVSQPVEWTAGVLPRESAKVKDKLIIQVAGHLQQGWHIYAPSQPSVGPIPLTIALDDNAIAQMRGRISGTAPTKRYDQAFQQNTELFLDDFTLRVPIEIQHPPLGKQHIPLTVRFQACNDRVCLSPRTLHLPVPIEVIQ